MRGLSEYVKIVEEIHFTHIRRRMIKPSMEICFGGFGDNNDSKELQCCITCEPTM